MFRVSARTVLQLGAELISSDAVAFYELIKNAFDAGSERVEIDIVVRVPHSALLSLKKDVAALKDEGDDPDSIDDDDLEEFRQTFLSSIDHTAPGADALTKAVAKASSWDDWDLALDEANYIDIRDFGHGMNRSDLGEIYLTIGTRSRLLERQKQLRGPATTKQRPILGEKGLGRLSAMRLGDCLKVRTAREADPNWNELFVDWRWFSHDSDNLIEDIEISTTRGAKKDRSDEDGTHLHIFALKTRWTEESAKHIAQEQFSRFTDPFSRKKKFNVSLRFNNRTVVIPSLDSILFENAHAVVTGTFVLDGEDAELTGTINYIARGRERVFALHTADLVSVTQVVDREQLLSLGPFEVNFYWYNRQSLAAVDGIGTKRQVQELVNRWSGGLMVFRDGFRVLPYGAPDDDWLDLDKKALASAGYKVNRKQLIGKVDITSRGNPALTDQTNREGLRDCDEKHVLISLLKHILEDEFRTFIRAVDDELAARMPMTFDDIHERVEGEEKRMRSSISRLIRKVPAAKREKALLQDLRESIDAISAMLREAEQLAESFDKGRTQVIHLAGLGMMVEVLAHELNRATEHSLSTLAEADSRGLPSTTNTWVSTLRSQLTTLQKRLKILDPLSTSGRQVKSNFDLFDWVQQIIATHEAQFFRHSIDWSVETEPENLKSGWPVRMVKGMVVQILENLLSNSVYWLKQRRKLEKRFKPQVTVTLRIKAQEIVIWDNGPGVQPSRRDEIFQPFVTTNWTLAKR